MRIFAVKRRKKGEEFVTVMKLGRIKEEINGIRR